VQLLNLVATPTALKSCWALKVFPIQGNPMKFQKQIDIIVILLVAVISISITILDFVGALDSIPWLSERIPTMTLLAIGIVAVYLLSQSSTAFKNVENVIRDSNKEVIYKIDSARMNQEILDNIERIWTEREQDFQHIFEEASNIAIKGGLETLRNYLKNCEEAFDKGDVFGTKLKYPWDINITAINSKGDYVYHITEDMISTRRNPDHPNWEILKKRNGTIIWINRTRGKLHNVENFPFHLSLRFTKVYFKEIPRYDIILIIQSHINILPNLPSLRKPD
jgi:hypothetical protein